MIAVWEWFFTFVSPMRYWWVLVILAACGYNLGRRKE